MLILAVFLSAFLSAVPAQQLLNIESSLIKSLKTVFNSSETNVGISPYYLNYACNYDITTRNVSEGCVNEMEIVCNTTDVLLTMADAWSKVPYAGMLTASRRDLGAFDQCISVEHISDEGLRIIGKQCTYGFAIPVNVDEGEIYLVSYCVPNACSAIDVARMMAPDLVPPAVVEPLFNEQVCSTKETFATMDGSSTAVAALFCFFLIIILASTILDILLQKNILKNPLLGKLQPLLIAFSLLTNGKKLAQTTTDKGNGEQILVFHGIKVLSMMWIVAGHAAAAFSELPVTDRPKVESVLFQRRMQYLSTAYLGVDTFFFISGFLLAYQYFKSAANKPVVVQIMSIPQMMIHRYLRITPVVLMFFLYSVYLSKHVGNGPIFPFVYDIFNNPCKEHWWAVFLYIQNYYNPTDMCWVHLWYLSADWQLFLISPLILIPMAWQFRKRFNHVMIGMIVLNIIFLVIPICTKILAPHFDEEGLEYETHSKLVTYFMGVTFGCYLRVKREKPYLFKNNMNLAMWCLTIVIMFAATTLYHEVNMHDYSHNIKSICEVLIKPFWCLGLAFVTYSCINGYGGIVNWALTAGWIQVISKLTFCLYIMHMPVIFFWVSIKRTRDHYSDFNLFFYWCGHYILSVIMAAIWSLAFESPLITIERFFLRGGRTRNNLKEKPNAIISIVHKPPKE